MQKQTGDIKDCATCTGRCPDLWKQNLDAWELWLAVDTQWRTTAFSIVGLDFSAVIQMADVLEVLVDKALIQKIKMLERYELKRAAKGGDGSGK